MARLSISAVIPTYNRASVLGRAIDSAVAQCEAGDEVIVVDDGSTDGTEAVVTAYGEPVRYLRVPHGGAGAARNAGVRAARGDLVAFLDSDDEWMSGKLALQRAILEHFPEVLFVFSDFGYVWPSGERTHHRLGYWDQAPVPWALVLGSAIPSATIPGIPADAPAFRLHIGRLYEHSLRHWTVSTITLMVRREAAGDALRFPEDVPLYEDLECYARLAAHGPAAFMDCETAWNHRFQGPRLTHADELTAAETALKVIGRVWGADPEYLRTHGEEYAAVMDGYRTRAARELLAQGRCRDAREHLARLRRPNRPYQLLSRLPPTVVLAILGLRRLVRRRLPAAPERAP